MLCVFAHNILGNSLLTTPIGCALFMANPLAVNSLGQGWRNVAPVLKGVK